VQAHGVGVSPEPGLSLLRLKRGDLDAATKSLQAALAEVGEDRLARARLLSARVEIALATGDLADARAAVTELEETAQRYGTAALGAAAEHTRGALDLASGNTDEAAAHLASAQRLWLHVEAPYDAARAGELLAEAHLDRGARDPGILELRAAASAVRSARRHAGLAANQSPAGPALGARRDASPHRRQSGLRGPLSLGRPLARRYLHAKAFQYEMDHAAQVVLAVASGVRGPRK